MAYARRAHVHSASQTHAHAHTHMHMHTCACTCTHVPAHAHMCLHMHAHTSTQVEYTLPRHHTQCIHARSSPNCPGAFCRFGTRQQTEALFAGCILPLWNAITKVTTTGRQKFLRVTRVRLSTGQRIVGVKVPIVAVVSLGVAVAVGGRRACNPAQSRLQRRAVRGASLRTQAATMCHRCLSSRSMTGVRRSSGWA